MDVFDYLDTDFGNVEDNQFHIDGYVYKVPDSDGDEKPYRAVQFSWCYIPLNKRDDFEYVSDVESECKQYIEDCTEEEAREYLEWYLNNCEIL